MLPRQAANLAKGAIVRVLILEPHASGHHGPYLQWMTTGLLQRGFRPTVVTLSESLSHPSMATIADAVEKDRVEVICEAHEPSRFLRTSNSSLGGHAGREFAYWRLFSEWYRAHVHRARPDIVFLPYMDYCLYAVGLLGSPFGNCPWIGLAMRPSFHYRQMGVIAPRPSLATVRKALFLRVLANRHLRRLLTIDEPLAQYLAAASTALGKKATFLPEPAELTDLPNPIDAKRRLGTPADRKLILVYGAISARKGVLELFQAVGHPGFPPSVDVLLAGELAPEIHQALVSPEIAPLVAQGRLRLLDRFITTEDESFLFAAADIVWLGYRGHYTASGVLVQAANTGRPVIACKEGIIGWQTQRHGLGKVVNPGNPPEVCEAVCALSERTFAQIIGTGAPLAPQNTFENACNILAAALKPSGNNDNCGDLRET